MWFGVLKWKTNEEIQMIRDNGKEIMVNGGGTAVLEGKRGDNGAGKCWDAAQVRRTNRARGRDGQGRHKMKYTLVPLSNR